MRIRPRFRTLALGALAALMLPGAAAHAAGFPPAEKIPSVSIATESAFVDSDGGDWLQHVGASVQLARWFALRGGLLVALPGEATGAEVDAVFLLPARLEVLLGAGTLRGEGESASFSRAGVYFRAWESPFAAVVVGVGVASTEPDGGDSETDGFFSVGWRGR